MTAFSRPPFVTFSRIACVVCGLLAATGCAPFPELNTPALTEAQRSASAESGLVPLGSVLAAADAISATENTGLALSGSVIARANALRARAARLRRPVITPGVRSRMRAGIDVAALR